VFIDQVLKSHGVGLSGCDKTDAHLATLQAESSLLRAAVENANNPKVSLLVDCCSVFFLFHKSSFNLI
jgi:hypothetical protein